MFKRPDAASGKFPHLEFYRQHFTITDDKIQPNGEVALMCPDYFHVPRIGKSQTEAPSFYVNVQTGEGYCHACKVTFTDPEGFIMEKEGVDYGEAKKILEGDPEPLPEALIDKWHNTLMGQPLVLSFLIEHKMLDLDTIKRFKLGFDGERIVTPIRNAEGEVVNVRKYLKGAKKNKVVSYAKGYGRTRVFPAANLAERGHRRLVMFGGEHKVMAADQESRKVPPLMQWASVATAGEGTMPPYLLRQFAEVVKQGEAVLYICLDIDNAGVIAAQRYANKLIPLGIECRLVSLPITEPSNGDFNDYLRQGGTAEGFLELLDKAEMLHVKQGAGIDDDNEPQEYQRVHLSEASQAHLTGKYIQTEVMVSGKDLHPYTLPKQVEYRCKMEWGEKCNACGLSLRGGELDYTVPDTDPKILTMLKVSEEEVLSLFRKKAHVTPKCPHLRLNVKEYMNVEEALLIPELDFSAEDREYATRIGYFIGHGLRANKSYDIKARSIPDPRSQYATLLVTEAHDGKSNVRLFQMTPALFEALKVFQGPPDEVFTKVATDLSLNVTKIYGRDSIIKAADFIFHSALSFEFMGKHIRKGYAECLIFGDTRTGKSEHVQNMHRHYRIGEFMDCGNVTFAGLVGGMQQVGNKRWQITWGKIPLNNGGLVTADEFSSLSLQIIGDLTGIRSSGIAEITKIQTERTQAQVRLIAISNPREMDMSLSKYNYGLHGVRELVGRPEDVARFDFVLGVAFRSDLDKLINAAQKETVEHVYTGDLCHNLILWAWSRKSENIHISAEAEQACLTWASKMGQDFSPQFPIVISADQRIKIARLAVATAIRCFSTEDGENVLVKLEHVEYAVKFLYEIYNDPALGYREFSIQLNQTRDKSLNNMVKILEWVVKNRNITDTLMQMPNNFKALDLMDLLALDKDEARSVLAFLKTNGLIAPSGTTAAAYKKEAHFIDILRNLPELCAEHDVDMTALAVVKAGVGRF